MSVKKKKMMKKKEKFMAPQQVGIERYLDYFDIMLLGKTGAGKTTTADKILAANPTGKEYSGEDQEDSVVVATEPDNETQGSEGAEADQDQDGASRVTSLKVQGSATQCHDLTMWHLMGDDKTVEDMTQRLKKLTLARCLEHPHEEITNSHQKSASTVRCELLSNDTSHVRVLDVPGFYGSNTTCSKSRGAPSGTPVNPEESNHASVRERVQETTETDLSIMRKILHIKMAMKFKFNRIVYFLPETGVLARSSQILRTELGIMENYFGSSIFTCMVVAATYNRGAYAKFAPGIDLYTPEEMETTKGFFQEALKSVLKEGEAPIPEPPLIFLSLWDTCEDLLRKIRKSNVGREGVNLSFNPSTCARCGIKIGRLNEEAHKRVKKKVSTEGERKDKEKKENTEVVAVALRRGESWSGAIPYEETTCHPMLIPKYTKVAKILGGIVHLITFKAFTGKWPDFSSMDEICIACKESPKSVGCTKVGTIYSLKDQEGFRVDHTSIVQEDFVIDIDPEGEMGMSVSDKSCVVTGSKFFQAKNAAYIARDLEKGKQDNHEIN